MTVREDGKQARSIVTVDKVLENSSLLDIEIVTGRTHQIRVHLSSLGNPVFGDHLYGFKNNRFVKNPKIMDFLKNYDGFALHASYIRFIHPATNKDFEIECLPGHSFNVIKSLLLEYKNGCTN
jgi:Pseudouridylate synthases, 23S RNA-specific